MAKDKPPQLVYIFTNASMKGIIKIGRTDKDIEQRLKDLSRPSGVPDPFECFCCCVVKDNKDIERRLHVGLSDLRYNDKREFFQLDPKKAQTLLIGYARRVLIRDGDEVSRSRKKKSPAETDSIKGSATFPMLGIPENSKLTFRDDDKITATVKGDDKIEFEGEPYSRSGLARKLLNTETQKQGDRFWKYEGELLIDRRKRLGV